MSSIQAAGAPAKRRTKFQVGERSHVNDKAPNDNQDRIGTITEIGPGKAEYGLVFDDGQWPPTGHLGSWCLDFIE